MNKAYWLKLFFFWLLFPFTLIRHDWPILNMFIPCLLKNNNNNKVYFLFEGHLALSVYNKDDNNDDKGIWAILVIRMLIISERNSPW